MRRYFSASLVAFFLVVSWSSGTVSANATTDSAQRFIANLADNSLKTLTGPNIDKNERRRRFRTLLHNNFAVKTIGRWVLGHYWRKAKPAQIPEYFALFENFIIKTYADRFAKLSGISLTITKAVSKGKKDTIVYSELRNDAGIKKASIDWRLRNQNGQFRIIDVMVQGISMGLTQRDEFASVIKKNGLGVEGLLQELRKREAL
ncbi:MAG: MlaC/ttg2D family ABC transporter substrate-binding protein [Rhodospirillales bacterium]